MNEIRRKMYELEMYAELVEQVNRNISWYQHTDDETGELVDDTDEQSQTRLSAYRVVAKAILKLAGV